MVGLLHVYKLREPVERDQDDCRNRRDYTCTYFSSLFLVLILLPWPCLAAST